MATLTGSRLNEQGAERPDGATSLSLLPLKGQGKLPVAREAWPYLMTFNPPSRIVGLIYGRLDLSFLVLLFMK